MIPTKKDFPIILKNKAKNNELRDALFNLDKSTIDLNNLDYLINIYNSSKEIDIRCKILKLLYDFDFQNLKDFFANAYKKERYLDMKIYALRGLSNFVDEEEISKLLINFNQVLAKRELSTPYNYQEYELLKGKNALPFLIKKYNYNCFKISLEQVNKQYNAMPNAFKEHFTTDENGDIIYLKSSIEIKKILDEFWNEKKQ